MWIFLLAMAWLALSTPSAHAQINQSLLWGELEPGPYQVGFRVTNLEDHARRSRVSLPFDDSEPSGRPIQVCLWYPADTAGKRPILFRDYVDTLTQAKTLDEQARTWAMGSLRTNINSADPLSLDEEKLEALAETPTMAVRDASPLAEKFPLLLWGARHSTCAAQSVLSEFLASHGYVVSTIEYRGLRPRNPWEDQKASQLLRTFETWTRDLEFGLSYLRTLDFVDTETTGVLSWSYGGLSAVELVLRNPDIDALVSLDATSWWTVEQLAESSYEDGSRIAAPSLIMTIEGRDNLATLFDSLERADAYLLTFRRINHGNFNALEGFIPELLGISPVAPWSVSGPDARLGYRAVAEYTRHFLDGYLKQSAAGLDFLNADPNDLVTLEKRSPIPFRPTDEEILDGLNRNRVPELTEARLLDVASRLVEEARFGEALRLLKLTTERFPDSAESHYQRAKAYLLIGAHDLARSFLRRTVELDPYHEAARHALSILLKEN